MSSSILYMNILFSLSLKELICVDIWLRNCLIGNKGILKSGINGISYKNNPLTKKTAINFIKNFIIVFKCDFVK